ncbi:L-seryl-tRNA(Sec) selenium transferase [Pseudomonadota bacterium]
MPQQLFSKLPSVDKVLSSEPIELCIQQFGRSMVLETVRNLLDELRAAVHSQGEAILDSASLSSIGDQVTQRLQVQLQSSLIPVFNLTGTVIHTNLGRAPMPTEAVEAMLKVVGASNLEYKLAAAKRGDRDDHLEEWLCRLTGAEAATVVNNNAAAVLLVLNTLAINREVPVSRGELIEIGGAFRIPDIMSRSGCRLIEVGTTNRTHLKDFRAAITVDTALLMKVHCSNYEVRGFTKEVSESELALLAHEYDLPFVIDLGSGTLVDLERYGLPHEPTPAEAFAHGADVLTFSGDKLLGGPQAGIIVGRKDLIAQIKSNPMKRALRNDKMSIAALDAVLRLYADPDRLAERLPVLRLLSRSQSEIEALAKRVLPTFASHLEGHASVEITDCSSQIGSGSLPIERLPSMAIAIRSVGQKKSGGALNRLADSFRKLPMPVIGRIHEGALLFDLRCLEDEAQFLSQLKQLDLSPS